MLTEEEVLVTYKLEKMEEKVQMEVPKVEQELVEMVEMAEMAELMEKMEMMEKMEIQLIGQVVQHLKLWAELLVGQ